MKAAILDGFLQHSMTSEHIRTAIEQELGSRCSVGYFVLRDMKIAHCTGCFGCWNKTPGMCVMKDDSAQIANAMVNSDLLIFLTPVTFGGYSSELKKALDRIICVISPFFTTINNETHHKARYTEYPRLMGIGVMPEQDTESGQIFSELICRNAINMHAPAHAAVILIQNQDIDKYRKTIRNHYQSLMGAV